MVDAVKTKISKGIEELISGEASARASYQQFLIDNPNLDKEDVKIIREIQSDETNHEQILISMAGNYDGIGASKK